MDKPQLALRVDRDDLQRHLELLDASLTDDCTTVRISFLEDWMVIVRDTSNITIAAEGIWPHTIETAPLWISQISKNLKPDDPVVFRVDQDHLCIGSYRVPCKTLNPAQPKKKPLPLDAYTRISNAARILEPFLVDANALTALVEHALERGYPTWMREEQTMIDAVARVWLILAPLGVETMDLRDCINAAVHSAMTRKRR